MMKYVSVVFKRDCPRFVSCANIKVYGPFKVGDRAEIPEKDAIALYRQGVIERFKGVDPKCPFCKGILASVAVGWRRVGGRSITQTTYECKKCKQTFPESNMRLFPIQTVIKGGGS